MTREPKNRKFSQDELDMLADIFRVILKEIRTVEDRDKLAPGELGIDYKAGELWIRSPYTGKLFSPNSAERLKLIGRKIVPGTTELNADRVNGVKFYTDLIELDKLNEAFTPDSVIRQMHRPSVLFAKVAYDNYKGFGWPAASGMVLCVKSTEEAVMIRYFPDNKNVTYTGQYNADKHLFEGWSTSDGSTDDFQASTEGTGTDININLPHQVTKDFTIVYVTVEETISPGANISVNGIEPKPIIDINGNKLAHEIVENTSIMLIYDVMRDAWIYVDRSETAMSAILKIVLERVASTDTLLRQTVFDRMMQTESRMQEEVTRLREQHDRELESMRIAYDLKFQQMLDGSTTSQQVVIQNIQNLQSEVATLKDKLAEKDTQLEALEKRVKKLEDNLIIMDL